MTKRNLLWIAGGVVAVALSYLLLDPIMGSFVAILVVCLVTVVLAASDWDRHPTYEQRELARAAKRKAKYERRAGARAKDRARWEAYQTKKAAGS